MSQVQRKNRRESMWIALGLVGVLWVVGMYILPDKNGPQAHHANPPAVAAAAQPVQAPAPKP